MGENSDWSSSFGLVFSEFLASLRSSIEMSEGDITLLRESFDIEQSAGSDIDKIARYMGITRFGGDSDVELSEFVLGHIENILGLSVTKGGLAEVANALFDPPPTIKEYPEVDFTNRTGRAYPGVLFDFDKTDILDWSPELKNFRSEVDRYKPAGVPTIFGTSLHLPDEIVINFLDSLSMGAFREFFDNVSGFTDLFYSMLYLVLAEYYDQFSDGLDFGLVFSTETITAIMSDLLITVEKYFELSMGGWDKSVFDLHGFDGAFVKDTINGVVSSHWTETIIPLILDVQLIGGLFAHFIDYYDSTKLKDQIGGSGIFQRSDVLDLGWDSCCFDHGKFDQHTFDDVFKALWQKSFSEHVTDASWSDFLTGVIGGLLTEFVSLVTADISGHIGGMFSEAMLDTSDTITGFIGWFKTATVSLVLDTIFPKVLFSEPVTDFLANISKIDTAFRECTNGWDVSQFDKGRYEVFAHDTMRRIMRRLFAEVLADFDDSFFGRSVGLFTEAISSVVSDLSGSISYHPADQMSSVLDFISGSLVGDMGTETSVVVPPNLKGFGSLYKTDLFDAPLSANLDSVGVNIGQFIAGFDVSRFDQGWFDISVSDMFSVVGSVLLAELVASPEADFFGSLVWFKADQLSDLADSYDLFVAWVELLISVSDVIALSAVMYKTETIIPTITDIQLLGDIFAHFVTPYNETNLKEQMTGSISGLLRQSVGGFDNSYFDVSMFERSFVDTLKLTRIQSFSDAMVLMSDSLFGLISGNIAELFSGLVDDLTGSISGYLDDHFTNMLDSLGGSMGWVKTLSIIDVVSELFLVGFSTSEPYTGSLTARVTHLKTAFTQLFDQYIDTLGLVGTINWSDVVTSFLDNVGGSLSGSLDEVVSVLVDSLGGSGSLSLQDNVGGFDRSVFDSSVFDSFVGDLVLEWLATLPRTDSYPENQLVTSLLFFVESMWLPSAIPTPTDGMSGSLAWDKSDSVVAPTDGLGGSVSGNLNEDPYVGSSSETTTLFSGSRFDGVRFKIGRNKIGDPFLDTTGVVGWDEAEFDRTGKKLVIEVGYT